MVCDLTRPETLENLSSYAEDLLTINPETRLILAANKLDLIDQHRLTETQVEAAATNFNSAPYYLTSAKNGDEVETLFRHLGQLLI